jgi:hypothetical protein
MPPITNNRDNNEIALDREVLFHAGSLRTSGSRVSSGRRTPSVAAAETALTSKSVGNEKRRQREQRGLR